MKNSTSVMIRHVLLFLVMVFLLGPIVWTLFLSLKTEVEIVANPFSVSQITFENYALLFTRFGYGSATLNSILIAFIVTIITIPVSAMAAYGLSRFPFPGVQWILSFFLFCRVLVPAILVLPLFQLMEFLKLRGTIWSIILGHLSWTLPFAVLLLYGFCAGMPKDLEEAAWLDGLSRWSTFWRIIFPLMAPGVATVGIFTFGASWGEFLFSIAFATSELRTGPTQVPLMRTEYRVWWGALAASGIYWSIPIILMATLFNKYMVRGLRVGY